MEGGAAAAPVPNPLSPPFPYPRPSASPFISEDQFGCHCCYDVLVNPTTLNCGHSFCRHCLALWWESSRKTECPECREKWEGFPKVNILLRDAVERLFSEVVDRRRAEIQRNPKISQSLLAFQRYRTNTLRASWPISDCSNPNVRFLVPTAVSLRRRVGEGMISVWFPP
uniref:RING-type domain-containing protein n=1 Tax=Hucho hucho TaxID=62062 RepID=A0A4W5KY84_9TELE